VPVKYCRFLFGGKSRYARVDERNRDLWIGDPINSPVEDYRTLLEHSGMASWFVDYAPMPIDKAHLLAPVRPSKIICVGRNYREHAKELGNEAPSEPIIFFKPPSSLLRPGGVIVLPAIAGRVDYEGELAVVIGRRCRYVTVDRALDVIAGYTIMNDVSVRDWQWRTPTFTMGKSFDTHGPCGPWIVTPDEIDDPQDLHIETRVNDDLRQAQSTEQMIFSVAEQISYLSTGFTLEPGDVISTGTPAGVGASFDPPRWLVPGDVVTITVGGIGTLRNPVAADIADV
jgi:2-keto-4-pentenoate hydratase/2-oxohepta-3-ene-1,7-dioic acid hydratase in catechol pathway